MPDNNGNRIMNIIFRISIIGVFYTGLKAIYNYYVLMQGYSSFKGEEFFGMVALLVNDYMFMLILMIVAVIFNVLTKKTLSSKAFTVRTVSIVAALIAGLMSFPAMGMFAYIAIAKYPQVAQITAYRSVYITYDGLAHTKTISFLYVFCFICSVCSTCRNFPVYSD